VCMECSLKLRVPLTDLQEGQDQDTPSNFHRSPSTAHLERFTWLPPMSAYDCQYDCRLLPSRRWGAQHCSWHVSEYSSQEQNAWPL
jgi:hypothetical protein